MTTATLIPTTTPTAPGGRRIARSGSASWASPVAWGAGLIQIALGAGALIAESGGPAIRAVGVLLVTLGLAALVWGALSLSRARLVAPRAVVAVTLTGLVSSAVALALDPVRISVFAVAAASVLLVAVALAAVRALRAGRADAAAPRISALLVAAVLVAALVTPALSATEAGRLAPDHGTHSDMVIPGHH